VSLLSKARKEPASQPRVHVSRNFTERELREVAVEWAMGRLSGVQVAKAMGCSRQNIAALLGAVLRRACMAGNVTITAARVVAP